MLSLPSSGPSWPQQKPPSVATQSLWRRNGNSPSGSESKPSLFTYMTLPSYFTSFWVSILLCIRWKYPKSVMKMWKLNGTYLCNVWLKIKRNQTTTTQGLLSARHLINLLTAQRCNHHLHFLLLITHQSVRKLGFDLRALFLSNYSTFTM